MNNITYDYYFLDGNNAFNSSEILQIQSIYINVKLNYAYNTIFSGNTIFGATEYAIYHFSYNNSWIIATFGNYEQRVFLPTISVKSSAQLTITFPKSTTLTGMINWSFGIRMI